MADINSILEHLSKETFLIGVEVSYAGWRGPLWGIWKRNIERRIEIYLGRLGIIIHWRP
jgi:hypothetical protein